MIVTFIYWLIREKLFIFDKCITYRIQAYLWFFKLIDFFAVCKTGPKCYDCVDWLNKYACVSIFHFYFLLIRTSIGMKVVMN